MATPIREGTCRLRDGRALAYAEWGVPDGQPVLAFHGMPGSRLWCPDDFDPGATTTECGVCLITVDRPGYGGSDPRPAHRVVDWADDVVQLLDELEIDRCAVVGASAGGPYALACAARLPQRISRAGSISGVGPKYHLSAAGEHIPDEWRDVLEVAAANPFAAIGEARERCRWLADEPKGVVDPANWPKIDRWLAEDPTLHPPLLAYMREAGRQGNDGYAWDLLAISLAWGFELGEVQAETWLWQGTEDPNIHRFEFELLCREIPRTHCILYPGEGHLLRGHWGEIFEALTGTASAARGGT